MITNQQIRSTWREIRWTADWHTYTVHRRSEMPIRSCEKLKKDNRKEYWTLKSLAFYSFWHLFVFHLSFSLPFISPSVSWFLLYSVFIPKLLHISFFLYTFYCYIIIIHILDLLFHCQPFGNNSNSNSSIVNGKKCSIMAHKHKKKGNK